MDDIPVSEYESTGSTKAKKLKRVRTTDGSLVDFGKIFLYMFMYLAITAAVAFGIGYVVYSNYIAAGNIPGFENVIPTFYLGLIIASGVALIIMTFVIQFIFIKGKHSVLIPAIIYSVLVGVLFSSLTIFFDWELMGMAFAITSGVFLIMALIAIFSKGNMAPLAVMAIGIFLGIIPLVLINLFLRSGTLYWVISFAIFAAVMFIAMFDVWRIKKICEQGEVNTNLALYCAFIMYTDFISVFIRILYFLAMIYGKNK